MFLGVSGDCRLIRVAPPCLLAGSRGLLSPLHPLLSSSTMARTAKQAAFWHAQEEVAQIAAGWGSVPLHTAEVGDWLEKFLTAEVCHRATSSSVLLTVW